MAPSDTSEATEAWLAGDVGCNNTPPMSPSTLQARSDGGDGGRDGGASSPPEAVPDFSLTLQRVSERLSLEDVVRAVQEGDLHGALALARSARVLEEASAPSELLALRWLREVAPRLEGLADRFQVPPAGDFWFGPYTGSVYKSKRLQHDTWYAWTGPKVLAVVSRTYLRASPDQGLALLEEAMLHHHRMPALDARVEEWSSYAPTSLVELRTKHERSAEHNFTVVQHACLRRDGDDDRAEGAPGFAILSWTLMGGEQVAEGLFNGSRPATAAASGTLAQAAAATAASTAYLTQVGNKLLLVVCSELSTVRSHGVVLQATFERDSRTCAERMLQRLRNLEEQSLS